MTPPPPAPRGGSGARGVGGRIAGIVLRTAHLLAVPWLAVALHADAAALVPAALALAGSGLALAAVEWHGGRLRAFELAGVVVIAKLVLAGWMAWRPASAPWLFWVLVAVSSLSSHAPRRLRHWPAPSAGGRRRGT